MVKIFLFLLMLDFSLNIYCQDTVFNSLDTNGRKTGIWKSYYSNGKLKYTGNFYEGNPTGEMKKYYPGGLVQAIIYFKDSGKISYTKLFNEYGKLVADGKYINKQKDSTWNYYSADNSKRVFTENYSLGKRNGKSYKYYSNGNISEIKEWKNDSEDGIWEQYYENGDIRLKSSHLSGSRFGSFQSYSPGKIMSIKGEYKNGLMNGKWTYYNGQGKEEYFIEYIDGKMLPNEEYEKRAEEFSKKVDEVIGDFPEPEEIGLP